MCLLFLLKNRRHFLANRIPLFFFISLITLHLFKYSCSVSLILIPVAITLSWCLLTVCASLWVPVHCHHPTGVSAIQTRKPQGEGIKLWGLACVTPTKFKWGGVICPGFIVQLSPCSSVASPLGDYSPPLYLLLRLILSFLSCKFRA